MTFAARFKRSLTIWIGFGCAGLYWAVAPFLPANVQTEWLRVFMIVLGFAIVASCAKAIRNLTLADQPVSAQQYILGTFFRELGLLGSAMWLLVWRGAGFPPWMVVSNINAFCLWLICLGQFFVLLAPRDQERTPPGVRWPQLVALLGISIVLGYLLLVLRPDFRLMASWLQTCLPVN